MKVTELLGINNVKYFQDSHTNTIGIDLQGYRIVRKGQFAYNRATTRNGDKISIALRQGDDCIVSPSYRVFESKDENVLNSEYLMMWFRRPEFDRYARFKSHGSAHEYFELEQMYEVELPIPHIDKQREIVAEYNTIIKRIDLNNQLIQKLEETAQAIYKQWFVDFEFPFDFAQGKPNENGEPYKSAGGEMEFNKELDREIPVGWEVLPLKSICSKIGSGATPKGGKTNYAKSGISLIRSQNVYDYLFQPEDIAFINNNQAKQLENVTVQEKDVLFNITGVSVARCCMVPKFILPARVNQHVMIVRASSDYSFPHYILLYLCHSDNKSKLLGISQSGSTREAITKKEVEDFQVLLPESNLAKQFEFNMEKIFNTIEAKVLQNKHLEDLRQTLLSKLSTVEN
ncbi:MAG: restriction endonuclease subunit S [Anaerolineales bacterium]